jgi:ABC-2 type transport system permease protein
MGSFAGTLALVRLALRRDRILLPAAVVAFVVMVTFSTSATVELYPTAESRVQAAAAINTMASLVALYGRIYDETSLGAVAMIKMTSFGAAMVALLGLFTVVRHSRTEEESGRLELLGGMVLGRYAPLTAALVVAAGACLVLGAATAIALAAIALPLSGAIAFGLSWAGIGVAFAAIAAITAQIARSSRAASGMAAAILAVAYVARAVGDISTGPARFLTWLSPVGWAQQVRPFAGDRWSVLLVLFGFTVAGAAVAFALCAHRDLGAGLLPDRLGRATARPGLRSPLALAWRLQRGVLAGWAVAFTLLGAVLGGISASIGDFFNTPQARAMIEAMGGKGSLIDAFVTAELGFMGIFAAAYAIQASLRLRHEEESLHVEPLLATAVTRLRWAGSHVLVATLGTLLLLVLSGLAAGGALAAATGDAGQVSRVLAGSLVQLPAALILAGLVVALFGFAPRFAALAWAILVAFVVVGELGALLKFPEGVMDLSPFAHVPRMPAAGFTLTPLLWLGVVAAALIAAGLVGFRRRDVG